LLTIQKVPKETHKLSFHLLCLWFTTEVSKNYQSITKAFSKKYCGPSNKKLSNWKIRAKQVIVWNAVSSILDIICLELVCRWKWKMLQLWYSWTVYQGFIKFFSENSYSLFFLFYSQKYSIDEVMKLDIDNF
jgi:hypothetical protein